VIYGLIFATFLTLVIVPVMYLLMTRFKYWIGGVKPVAVSENGAVLKPAPVEAV
jgi:hypothetical protein